MQTNNENPNFFKRKLHNEQQLSYTPGNYNQNAQISNWNFTHRNYVYKVQYKKGEQRETRDQSKPNTNSNVKYTNDHDRGQNVDLSNSLAQCNIQPKYKDTIDLGNDQYIKPIKASSHVRSDSNSNLIKKYTINIKNEKKINQSHSFDQGNSNSNWNKKYTNDIKNEKNINQSYSFDQNNMNLNQKVQYENDLEKDLTLTEQNNSVESQDPPESTTIVPLNSTLQLETKVDTIIPYANRLKYIPNYQPQVFKPTWKPKQECQNKQNNKKDNGISIPCFIPTGNLDYEEPNQNLMVLIKTPNVIASKKDWECDSVIDSASDDLDKLQNMTAIDFNKDRYARHGTHEIEIKDYVRTISYQRCLKECSEQYIKNKVVLVVRCGVGLLPMLCIRFGLADKVIALEQSACIEYARCVIRDNMFHHKITLIQSSVHDLKQLPYGLSKVDVIVSDFLGECVVGQGDQMEQVIEARDRFLKPNGLILPMCVSLYAQLSEQRTLYENSRIRKNKNKKLENFDNIKKEQSEIDGFNSDSSSDSTCCSWWKNAYGFDMRSNVQFLIDDNSESGDFSRHDKKWYIMPEPIFTYFDPCKVVSRASLIKKFDMHKCTIAEVRHVHYKDIEMECSTPYASAHGGDYAHMLEMFMVVDFPNKPNSSNNEDLNIGFSTSSFSPYTRFKQTGLLLRDQLRIFNGDKFTINEFTMWRGPQINQENKQFDTIYQKTCKNSMYEENLKIRLKYSYRGKNSTAINRGCVYTVQKYLF